MTPDKVTRWAQVEQVLDQLLDVAPEKRATLLDRLTSDDTGLRSEVEALLAADEEAGHFLETSAIAMLGVADDSVPSQEAPQLIGPYRLTQRLGRGGMGTVYLAEGVDEPSAQQVAVKLIRHDSSSPELRRRFLSERHILARLNHPNIARLLNSGMTVDGQPWFALEYVEGEPVNEYAHQRALSLNERLALFTQVGDAVDHAHSQGVIHRDIKPSNIMVTANGQVKLLDFGIAKDTIHSGRPTTLKMRVLTPEYCAPEQLMGEPATVATDVYALGLVLYELLTGTRGHRLDRRFPSAMYEAVRKTDPVPPSLAVLEPGERGAETDRLDLGRQLRGDIDAIVMLALRKSPEERYPSVKQLLEDLERYRAGQPVLARRDTTAYRFQQ